MESSVWDTDTGCSPLDLLVIWTAKAKTSWIFSQYLTQTWRLLAQAFDDVWLSDISTNPVSHSSLMNMLVSGQRERV